MLLIYVREEKGNSSMVREMVWDVLSLLRLV